MVFLVKWGGLNAHIRIILDEPKFYELSVFKDAANRCPAPVFLRQLITITPCHIE
jgi:hypothetical protein